jgi:NADH-quinone oxidoreductase subunit C
MNDVILNKLSALGSGVVLGSQEFRGELTVTLTAGSIVKACTLLRDDPELEFAMLIDLTAVDRYTAEKRFEVVYHLYSLKLRRYLVLKVQADENRPEVPSVTGVWKAADWHERETFDMFGIRFSGHPDLRRLYMPEEFEYHPLRKDFPLMGIPDSLPLPRR